MDEESRKREGQLPLLPEHSSVVFDEGHLLEFAAQKALTYRVKQSMLETFLERLLQNDIREEFAELVEDALATNDEFFYLLKTHAKEIKGSHRLEIGRVDEVKRSASELCDLLEKSEKHSYLNQRCIQLINTNCLLWKSTLNKWRILCRFIKKCD